MDAIRKKMQSLKSETDGLYAIIDGFEEATKESAAKADQVHFPIDRYQFTINQTINFCAG